MGPRGRIRKKGGRKKASLSEPELVPQLQGLVAAHTAGSAVEPGRVWTNRSCASLAEELADRGFSVCANTVDRLLRNELGLSRRKMEKTLPLGQSADRDAQFQRLQQVKQYFLARRWPVISINTKNKELWGTDRAGRSGLDRQSPARLGSRFPQFQLGKGHPVRRL